VIPCAASAAKERITTLLAKALPEISAEKGMFLDWRAVFIALWQAEHALPQNGKLHNLLVNIIDEFPLIEFVRSTLATELYDLDKYRSDVDSIKLTEIQEYSDPTAAASRLVDLFDSLPWNYVLSVPLRPDLGSLLPTNNSEYQLGPEVNIVCPNEDFAQQFPLAADTERQNQRIHPPSNPFSDPFAANPFSDPFAASLDGSALLPPSPTPNRSWNSTLYLQIRADGFIGSYGGSEPALNAERTIRAICGLGLALWLFDFERKYSPEIPSYLVVHRRVGGRWKIETQFKATDRTSRALDGLKLHALDGLDTDQSRIAWRSRKLDEMQIIFSAGDKAQSIILASQWLMNSYTERDELLMFKRWSF